MLTKTIQYSYWASGFQFFFPALVLLYFFTYKSSLTKSQDPKLVKHDSGQKLSKKKSEKYQL